MPLRPTHTHARSQPTHILLHGTSLAAGSLGRRPPWGILDVRRPVGILDISAAPRAGRPGQCKKGWWGRFTCCLV
ncbi:hypothetical protein BDA96_08G039400 [Sorghum bicolor]|uniref:Uncharacterized protein n=1 Tax=Sorghum bicolor TaxID=4558 RepID=A0A921U5Z6_SORBI|nr:hypothetical protein BDA96_08G039400 [Sorghum bicolor]